MSKILVKTALKMSQSHLPKIYNSMLQEWSVIVDYLLCVAKEYVQFP